MCTLTLSLPAVFEADDRRAWYFSLDGEAAALILRTCNNESTQRYVYNRSLSFIVHGLPFFACLVVGGCMVGIGILAYDTIPLSIHIPF